MPVYFFAQLRFLYQKCHTATPLSRRDSPPWSIEKCIFKHTMNAKMVILSGGDFGPVDPKSDLTNADHRQGGRSDGGTAKKR